MQRHDTTMTMNNIKDNGTPTNPTTINRIRSRKQVYMAIKKLKGNQAPRSDRIPAKCMKSGEEALTKARR